MITNKDIIFLRWFTNRLVYKYGLKDDTNFNEFRTIIDGLNPDKLSIKISVEDLDKIIGKYYTDFFLDKAENLGFTENERQKLRSQILNLTKDIITKNIPKTQDILT